MYPYEAAQYIYDEYEHLSARLFYTITRIPGKGLSESDFLCFESGCNCQDSQCTEKNNCSCLKYGVNYRRTEEGLVLDKDKFGDTPIYECNGLCSCFENVKKVFSSERVGIVNLTKICRNRNIQFGPADSLEIFYAGPKGLGIRTNRKIPAGGFICEYAGEVITLEEARRRHDERRLKNEMNFIFILKEYSGSEVTQVTCVDPTFIGNIGRYINHSCDPNSKIVPVRVNDNVPWLSVFAVRDIMEGEEICYDYSGCGLDDVAGEVIEGQRPCFCGAEACRKYLPFASKI